jgi:hypothetical protein
MKHLLNNMTESEKSAIREQHSGGMKVMTEKFSKLTNSKLGDSRPLVVDQPDIQRPDEDYFEGQESHKNLVSIVREKLAALPNNEHKIKVLEAIKSIIDMEIGVIERLQQQQ